MFAKLTLFDGRVVHVNMDRIEIVVPLDGGSQLFVAADPKSECYSVQETPEQVIAQYAMACRAFSC